MPAIGLNAPDCVRLSCPKLYKCLQGLVSSQICM